MPTRLTVYAPLPAVECGADDRTIHGLALPFGEVGRTSAGPVTVAAGAVRVPDDRRRVKLYREHGRQAPVGYLTASAEDPAVGLSLTFHAGRTPDGDRALIEAAEGIRDAFSVELDDVAIDAAGVITDAALTGVALTSIPAFAAARVVASQVPPDDPAEDATTDDAEDGDAEDDAEDGAADTEESDVPDTPAPPTAGARGPAGVTAARRRTAGGRLTLDAAMRRVRDVVGDTPHAGALNAALADITPGSDTSDGAWIRPQWVDELWTPVDTRRNYVNSITSATLTGMTVHGWKWGVRPNVQPYTGNKAAVPSNSPTFLPASADAVRHAGGWDVDNILVYLGDGSILTAILNAAALDYAQDQETYVSTQLQAEATDVATAAGATLADALALLAATLGGIGASPSFVAIASDLWGTWLNMPASDAPWWLTAGGGAGVDLVNASGTASGLRVWNDPGLPAGHVLGGDRRAATFYEPRGNPFRVQAVNLPNGGVDIGVFGFCALLVNDDRAIVDVTVTPALP